MEHLFCLPSVRNDCKLQGIHHAANICELTDTGTQLQSNTRELLSTISYKSGKTLMWTHTHSTKIWGQPPERLAVFTFKLKRLGNAKHASACCPTRGLYQLENITVIKMEPSSGGGQECLEWTYPGKMILQTTGENAFSDIHIERNTLSDNYRTLSSSSPTIQCLPRILRSIS